MPDHDLQPPRFSRTALEQLLDDWPAVRAMIMSGSCNANVDEQSGTALLDKFTYKLLSKCSPEVSFLGTTKIINSSSNYPISACLFISIEF